MTWVDVVATAPHGRKARPGLSGYVGRRFVTFNKNLAAVLEGRRIAWQTDGQRVGFRLVLEPDVPGSHVVKNGQVAAGKPRELGMGLGERWAFDFDDTDALFVATGRLLSAYSPR